MQNIKSHIIQFSIAQMRWESCVLTIFLKPVWAPSGFFFKQNLIKMIKIAIQKSGRLNIDSLEILKQCGISIDNGKDQLKVAARNFPLEVLYLRNGARDYFTWMWPLPPPATTPSHHHTTTSGTELVIRFSNKSNYIFCPFVCMRCVYTYIHPYSKGVYIYLLYMGKLNVFNACEPTQL